MQTTVSVLLAEIEAFLVKHEMPPTLLGLCSVNDGHLVRDLRAGKDIRASKIDRVREFMRTYRAVREVAA